MENKEFGISKYKFDIVVDVSIVAIIILVAMLVMQIMTYWALQSVKVEVCVTHEQVVAASSVEVDSEVVAEELEVIEYFDVPMDITLQDHIFEVCEAYDVKPEVVVAMIEKESSFDTEVIGDVGNSFGLMQIQRRFHEDRMKRLGVTDLLNPFQNIAVGVDYLAEMIDRGKGLEWALMAYNGGPGYANKMAGSGRVSNYATYVIDRSEELAAEMVVM